MQRSLSWLSAVRPDAEGIRYVSLPGKHRGSCPVSHLQTKHWGLGGALSLLQCVSRMLRRIRDQAFLSGAALSTQVGSLEAEAQSWPGLQWPVPPAGSLQELLLETLRECQRRWCSDLWLCRKLSSGQLLPCRGAQELDCTALACGSFGGVGAMSCRKGTIIPR